MITVLGASRRRDAATAESCRSGAGSRPMRAGDRSGSTSTMPGEAERRLLTDVFHFHELAVEDALAEVHHPKIETYGGFLYLILHGIVAGEEARGLRDARRRLLSRPELPRHGASRAVAVDRGGARGLRAPSAIVLGEGAGQPAAPASSIGMVDHYGPEVDALEERLERARAAASSAGRRRIRCATSSGSKRTSRRCGASTLPQRDAVSRLARREFPQIPETLAYRFRDVYDHLVRLTDEAIFLQDRVTGLLDAYLSTQSNRLNQVMKVLTVIATIFMPLTVLTGHVRHERRRCRVFPGRRRRAVLVGRRHHGRPSRRSCSGSFREVDWL